MSSQRVVIQRLLKLAYVPPQPQQSVPAPGGGGMDMMALLGGGGQADATPTGGAQAGGGSVLSSLMGGGGAPTQDMAAQQTPQSQDMSISAKDVQQVSPDEFTATTPEMQTVLDAMNEVRAALDKLNEAIKVLSQTTGGRPEQQTSQAQQVTSTQQPSTQCPPAKSAYWQYPYKSVQIIKSAIPESVLFPMNLLRILECNYD